VKECSKNSAHAIDTPDIQPLFANHGEGDYLGSTHEIDYGEELGCNITPKEKRKADDRREQIAQAMWQDYQNELARRAEVGE
jgi:hypothetical protein